MLKSLLARALSGLMASLMPAFDGIIMRKLKPGLTTAQDVRNRMGAPTLEWTDANGSQTWEYPRTPNGIVNYMIDFDPDARVRAVRQVLCPDNFARVKKGMNVDQVRRLLGKSAHIYHFTLKHEYVWDWRTPSTSGMDEFFNVHFSEDGLVVRISTNVNSRS